MTSVVAFLPCRAGSERAPRKNTRPFAGIENGLLQIKLEQLADTLLIEKILVSTNDPEVIDIAEGFSSRTAKSVVIDRRPDILCSSDASTDSVIRYAANLFQDEVLFWTHVTSPFVGSDIYDDMCRAYLNARSAGTHDSLMAVCQLRTFLWNETGPINYDRDVERWPRTQTLSPIYEVNSAAFVIGAPLMREMQDRVGRKPFLYQLAHDIALDIDWEEDFIRAEALYRSRHLMM